MQTLTAGWTLRNAILSVDGNAEHERSAPDTERPIGTCTTIYILITIILFFFLIDIKGVIDIHFDPFGAFSLSCKSMLFWCHMSDFTWGDKGESDMETFTLHEMLINSTDLNQILCNFGINISECQSEQEPSPETKGTVTLIYCISL